MATAGILEHIDISFMMDNEALYDIYKKKLNVMRPSYDNINHLISKAISSLTASIRFEGELNLDMEDLKTNLIPFPRLKFMTTSLAPILTRDKMKTFESDARTLTDLCFDESSFFVEIPQFDASEDEYICSLLMFRGNIVSKDASAATEWVKENKKCSFVDWSPCGFKICLNEMPPACCEPSGDSSDSDTDDDDHDNNNNNNANASKDDEKTNSSSSGSSSNGGVRRRRLSIIEQYRQRWNINNNNNIKTNNNNFNSNNNSSNNKKGRHSRRNSKNYIDGVKIRGSKNGRDIGYSKSSAVMIGNNLGIARVFANRLCKKFDLMYSQRAYVHWYVGEGMEEGEFEEARDDLGYLEKDYLTMTTNDSDTDDDDDDYNDYDDDL